MAQRARRRLVRTLLGIVVLLGGTRGMAHANPADVDPTFGTAGRVTTPIGASYTAANALVRQTDGKLVVAGSVWNGTNFDFGIARYTAAGVLDGTFGSGGTVVTPIGSSDD